MKSSRKVIYEKRECLRAEVFKNLSYFFGSIVGIAIVKIFIYKESFMYYYGFKGLVTLISLLAALYFISTAITILEKLDLEINLKDKAIQKITGEEKKS